MSFSASRLSFKIMAIISVFLIPVILILGLPEETEAASWTNAWTTISSPDNGGPATPRDIAVDKTGNLYVTNGSEVDVLYKGSTQWQTLTKTGLTANPYSIAVDKQGSVYVLDYNVVQMLPVGTDSWVNIGGRTATQVWVPGQYVYLVNKWTWIDGYWQSGTSNNGNMFVPTDIEVDDDLNVYVTNNGDYNTDHNTYQSCEKLVNGTWTVIGNYTNGLYYPEGVAVDAAGNVYVSSAGDDSIRILSGGSWHLFQTDGGNYPNYVGDIAVDKWGNIYIDSLDDHSTKVWNGTQWLTVGTAGTPECVTVDSDGNVYVIDTTYNRILKQQAPATQLVWTNQPGGGVGGQAWSQAQQPQLVLKDANGNIEVNDSSSKVTVTMNADNGATLSGTKTVTLVNGVATFTDLKVDKLGTYTLTATSSLAGSITSAASTNFSIVKPAAPVVTNISPSSSLANGGVLVTITGTGLTGVTDVYFGAAVVSNPIVINDTTLTVTTPGNSAGKVDVQVKTPYWTSEINPNVQLTYTAVTSGVWVGPWTNLGTGALNFPQDVAVDNAGNVYVADTLNNRVAKLPSGSSQWENVGGFADVCGLDIDDAGNLYIAINNEYKIMKRQNGNWYELPSTGGQWYANDVAVDSKGNVYTTKTGVKKLPSGASEWQDISGNLGACNTWGIAADQWDNIYVVDPTNCRILELPNGSTTWQDITNGGGFSDPRGITVNGAGNIYVSDYTAKSIKELLSGSTQWQDITFGGGFQGPRGMAADSYGNLYVSDVGTNVIKRHQAPATKLEWQQQPGGHKDRVLAQPPIIKLVDANGNTELDDSTHSVTVSLNSSDGAALSGTTTVTMSNGVAAFTDLKVDKLGTYSLNASINIIGIDTIESNNFTITNPLAPVVSSVSPNYGIQNGGTQVTITGTGFLEAYEVYFGDAVVTNPTVLSDTLINVISPSHLTGAADVRVKTPYGTSEVNSNDKFNYLSLTIASISPDNGPANGGTKVTLTGTGFTGVNEVYFGSLAVANPVVLSDTMITVYTPTQASGLVDVQVKKTGFLSDKNSNARFTYTGALAGAWVGTWTTLANSTVFSPSGDFRYPQALTVDSSGNLYVSDSYINKVKYKPADSTIWQDTGSTNGYPFGLALDSTGNLYIAYNDSYLVVEKYTNGTWRALPFNGAMYVPKGVAVDSKGNVYTTGSGVKKLPSGGTQWQDISGNMGSYPTWGIAVDRWDNIYVADTYYQRILELPNGSNTWQDITYGGGFWQAQGIAVDSFGNIYVADSMNKQIKVLPSGGTQWQLINPASSNYGILGIGLDGSGNLYITDDYTVRKLSAPATSLVWETQPGGGQAGTIWAQQPVLKLVDAKGNVVSDSYDTVTVSLVDANGATLGGSTTVTLQNGIATFNDLKVDNSGTYTLALTFSTANANITRPNSNSFTITKGTPSQLVWQTQPVGAKFGEQFSTQPVLTIQDNTGNVITDDNSSTVALALTSANGANLGGTKQITFKNGVASFTDLYIDKVGSYNLTPTCNIAGISAVPSESFIITPGGASQLVWHQQPGNGTAGSVLTQAPVLYLEDAEGNIIIDDSTSTVTLAAIVGPNGATLSGETVTLQNGIATFTDFKVDKVGLYRLIPSSSLTGISSPTSAYFDISLGNASQLIWQTQPSSSISQAIFSAPLVVALADVGGNIITSDSSSTITVALTTPDGATLSGNKTLKLVDGKATFTDLKIDKAGNYTLTPTSSLSGIIGNPSNSFAITFGTAAKLEWQTQPGNGTGGTALTEQPVLRLADASGNTITSDSSSIVTVVITNVNGATLGGTKNATLQNGIASFTDLNIDKIGTYTLTPALNLAEITTTLSSSFTITVGSAATLEWQTQPGDGFGGIALTQQPVLLLKDLGGNVITSDSSSTVTLVLTVANGGVLAGSKQVTVQNGRATFTDLRVDKPGTYTLTATSSLNITCPASNPFTIAMPPVPVVTSINPASGSANGGTLVTLTGTGLTGTTEVYFGATAVANPTVVNDTTLTVTSPKQVSGTVDVRVKTPYWTSEINTNVRFTYTTAPPQNWVGSWITIASPTDLGQTNLTYVAADSVGNVYAADNAGNRILKLPIGSTSWQTIACNSPSGVAVDTAGNLFATSEYKVVKLNNGIWQEVSTVSWKPAGIAIDSHGNIYATSSSVCAVYKLPAGGTQWQIISNNIANLDFGGIAIDQWDHVYVTTFNQQKIYELPNNSTVWLDITNGGGFFYPYGITTDNGGNIFVCDTYHNTIKLLPSGATQWRDITMGGNFSMPYGITADNIGNLYVTDNGSIKRHQAPAVKLEWQQQPGGGQEGSSFAKQPVIKLVDSNGNTEASVNSYAITVALNDANGAVLSGTTTVNLVQGEAVFADLKIDKAGTYTLTPSINLTDITVADSNPFVVTVPIKPVVSGVSPGSGSANGFTLTTIAGSGFTGDTKVYFGNVLIANPTVLSDSLITVYSPRQAAGTVDVKVQTPLFTSDTNANTRFTYASEPAGVWLGNWTTIGSFTGGPSSYIQELVVDSTGNVFVADNYGNKILKLPSGSAQWEAISCNRPTGIAVDGEDNVYVSIYAGENNVMKISNGNWQDISFAGGPSVPTDIAVDSKGNVYTSGYNIQKLPAGSTQWQDISSNIGSIYTTAIEVDHLGNVYVTTDGNKVFELPNGIATWQDITYAGGFNQPEGITVDNAGNIFVADTRNHKIKELTSGRTEWRDITAGEYFDYPTGIALDSNGYLYVADLGPSVKKHQPPAAKLEWQTQPGGGNAGTVWTQQPIVILVDANGDVETGDSTDKVTVTLNASNGAALTGTTTVTLLNGAAAFTDLKVDRPGVYTISLSFSLNNGDIITPDSNAFTIIAESIYQVSFDNEGVITTANSNDSGTVSLPPAPTKPGYVFGGWFTGTEGTGSVFTGTTLVTADLTVYAYWVAPPTPTSAATDAEGTKIIIKFNKAMSNPAGQQAQFTVNVAGTQNEVIAAALNADSTKIELLLTDTVTNGQTITLTYTAGVVTSVDGGLLDSFGPQTVTNSVPIPAATLESIAITNPATKLSYTVGESLSITGLEVTGTYSDNSTKAESITAANVSGFDSTEPAVDQELTITVGGKTTTYKVTINAAQVTLESIAITSPATKINYTLGETLDITGLVITGTYSDNSTIGKPITVANVTGFDSTTAAVDQELTITVEGKTTTYTVTINAVPVTLESIAITNPPNKLSYTVGESLSITGLEVTGTYSDNSSKTESITAANITGFDSTAPAVDQELTITVEGKTTTYKVTINAASITLESIAITSPAAKLSYTVGESLSITGLEVTGTYSDNSTKVESITAANVTGFDSSAALDIQVLTITVGGKTTSYNVQIIAAANDNDATLSDLKVNGTTVTGFVPTKLNYDVVLAAGTIAIPTVVASATDAGNAVVTITPATALPGTTQISVTAKDGVTKKTYTIEFTVSKEIVKPEAPEVTRNDITNSVSGMTPGMEYNLDDSGYVAYVQATFEAINFSGNHTLRVRVAAEGDNPASDPTVLIFTANPINGGNNEPNPGNENGTVSTEQRDGKTITTITLDPAKIDAKLDQSGNGSTIIIPVNNNPDVVVGQLNGQTVKNMENKEAILEVKTENVTYTLPASQINIDEVSSQIGEQVDLKDIKVNITIATPSADTARVVQDTANKNNYQVVVKPVDFEITCTSGSKTVDVNRFNGYVERTVAIPDGIDPSKITTGIVLNQDGTFSHVPTSIIKIGNKYFAKINSLTNSTYSVIYNPKTFMDVEQHWAKGYVNEMGSRLIVTGLDANHFVPEQDITRAEFAAILVRALGLRETNNTKGFIDIDDSDWFTGVVAKAMEYGIVNGMGDGSFKPNKAISREEAMAMIVRAMKISKMATTLSEIETTAQLNRFKDQEKLSDWAKASAAVCIKLGIMEGSNGILRPQENITRAETATIILRMLKQAGLI